VPIEKRQYTPAVVIVWSSRHDDCDESEERCTSLAGGVDNSQLDYSKLYLGISSLQDLVARFSKRYERSGM